MVSADALAAATTSDMAWRDLIRSVTGARLKQQMQPAQYVACTSEIANAALKVRQARCLVEDAEFESFLRHMGARLYGFSGYHTYLLVAVLAKLPTSPATRVVRDRCFEQLEEDMSTLETFHLGHLGILLASATGSGGHAPIWTAYVEDLTRRRSELAGKELTLATAGLAQMSWHCSDELKGALCTAAGRSVDDLAPSLLPGLLCSFTRLALGDRFVRWQCC